MCDMLLQNWFYDCSWSLLYAGCMESLVHYKSIILRRHSPNSDSLTAECLNLLEQLKVLDPARRQRYEEIGKLLTIVCIGVVAHSLRSFRDQEEIEVSHPVTVACLTNLSFREVLTDGLRRDWSSWLIPKRDI